jgi:hypothetical protein
MDLRDPTDVQMYVDGVNVLPASVFDISGATTLQLLAHLEKTTGTDTAEVDVDFNLILGTAVGTPCAIARDQLLPGLLAWYRATTARTAAATAAR